MLSNAGARRRVRSSLASPSDTHRQKCNHITNQAQLANQQKAIKTHLQNAQGKKD